MRFFTSYNFFYILVKKFYRYKRNSKLINFLFLSNHYMKTGLQSAAEEGNVANLLESLKDQDCDLNSRQI